MWTPAVCIYFIFSLMTHVIVVPLMGSVATALKDNFAVRRSRLHGAVSLADGGSRIRKPSIYGYLKRLNRRRGADAKYLHPHLFRHSLAVHILQQDADFGYIQEVFSHVNIDTTRVYLNVVNK